VTTEEPTSLEGAVTHLQAAARELIAAARAVLDLTEGLVEDPGPLLALVSSLAATRRPPTAPEEEAAPARPRVQHIRIS